jgi:pimeloyl-ACP methyl ester carboxylesterase
MPSQSQRNARCASGAQGREPAAEADAAFRDAAASAARSPPCVNVASDDWIPPSHGFSLIFACAEDPDLSATRSVDPMDIILIPGFWLDASSWDEVVPTLEKAGHRVRALTLPGLESADAERSGIRLHNHVDAVVAAVDEADTPVVLVGHSAGGAIAHAAADARPDRVARVVYVDAGPVGEGRALNDELPVVGDKIPLPDWSEFEEEDLRDLDDELREAFRARAVPQPAAVARDPQVLRDERRYDVPATIIACEFPSTLLQDWITQGHPYVAELAAMREVEYIDLPTGHWPQFTKPAELGAAILTAVSKRSRS